MTERHPDGVAGGTALFIRNINIFAYITLTATGGFSVANLDTYDSLEWDMIARPSATTTRDILLSINGDTTDANYESFQHYGGDAHNVGITASRTAGWCPYWATTQSWNYIHGKIPFCSMGTYKIFETFSCARSGTTTGLFVNRFTQWQNTAQVSYLAWAMGGDAFAVGSRLRLYGYN